MYETRPIPSLDLPELAIYRTMKRQEDHRREGLFVAEGDKVVERLLLSSLPVQSVVLPDHAFPRFEGLIQARSETIPVYLAPKRVLEEMTGFPLYQGIMAVGQVPPAPSLDQLLDPARKPHLIVALDGISSSENVGALIRTATALGASGILSGNSCSPWLRRAVRASMGAVFRLPVMEVPALEPILRWMQARGIRSVAAHPHASRQSLPTVDLTGDRCLVLGSEGDGISRPVLDACEVAVAVPMSEEIDSLNVGSAAAVFLYEAARQRGRV